MNVPTWLPVLAMAVGVAAVLRATVIVATKGNGWFRGDPMITLMAGFGLILLGQSLLRP